MLSIKKRENKIFSGFQALKERERGEGGHNPKGKDAAVPRFGEEVETVLIYWGFDGCSLTMVVYPSSPGVVTGNVGTTKGKNSDG